MAKPVEGEVAPAAFWTFLEYHVYAVATHNLPFTLFVSAGEAPEPGLSESWTHLHPSSSFLPS
jgi:hypothetical protein